MCNLYRGRSMSDAESFGDNPFRALKAGQYPDKNRAGAARPSVEAAKRSRRVTPCLDAGEDVSGEDSELFLNAMRRVRPVDGKARGGFSLADMGAMPAPDAARKPHGDAKRRARAVAAAPQDRPSFAREPADGRTERAAPAASVPPVLSAGDEGDADAAAFLRAMNAVRPLASRGRDVAPLPPQGTPPPQGEASMQDVMDGKLEFALSLTDEYMEGHVVGLDEMTMNKLRSGSLSPEAHLDLHGLNAVQAFEALRGFFRGSWYKGLRVVLVVPGRGRNSPDGVGVLREKLQNWLTQEPFKRVVLAFCTAQPHDGGPGSVYVLLRKYRKKGRVFWERMPADADLY